MNKNNLSVPKDKPSFNQWTALVSDETSGQKVKEKEKEKEREAEVEKSPMESGGAKKKQPFLARGSGRAGGG